MARIAIVGAGLGCSPTAYELRHILPLQPEIKLISDKIEFTFIPSLPWVALGGDRQFSNGLNRTVRQAFSCG